MKDLAGRSCCGNGGECDCAGAVAVARRGICDEEAREDGAAAMFVGYRWWQRARRFWELVIQATTGRQAGGSGTPYSGVVAGAVPGWLRGRVGGRGFCMVRSRLIGANGIGPAWAVDPSASTLEAERERSPEYLH